MVIVDPVGDRVAVKCKAATEVSKGGIVIPSQAQEKTQEGTVVAMGQGRALDNGKFIAPPVDVGDQVLFGKYSGTDIEVNGEKLLILNSNEIFAVIKESQDD